MFCPTPKAMKEALLSDLAGYLQYKITLCKRELTDGEREIIRAQIDAMEDSIQ